MCRFPGGIPDPEFLRSELLAPPLCIGLVVGVDADVVVDVDVDDGVDVVDVPFVVVVVDVSCVVGVEFRRDEKNPTFETLRRTPKVLAECRRSKIPKPRFSGFSSDIFSV